MTDDALLQRPEQVPAEVERLRTLPGLLLRVRLRLAHHRVRQEPLAQGGEKTGLHSRLSNSHRVNKLGSDESASFVNQFLQATWSTTGRERRRSSRSTSTRTTVFTLNSVDLLSVLLKLSAHYGVKSINFTP